MKEVILEKVNLVLDGKEVEITFPSKIKQQMQIEVNKSLFSNGSYALLSMSSVNSSNRILDMIDMLSHFFVVIPDFNKILGLEQEQVSVMDLDYRKVEQYVKIYNTDYALFYNQFVSPEERIGTFEIQQQALKFDRTKEEEQEQKEQE